MAENRGFRILPSYYDAIRPLPDAERLMLWDAIMDYGCTGIITELPPMVNAVFKCLAPNIAKSVKYFQDQSDKAQNRQDAIRGSAASVPEECRKSAGIQPKECCKNATTMREVDSDMDCDHDGDIEVEAEDETHTTAAAMLHDYGITESEAMKRAVIEDVSKYGEANVREALRRAAESDKRGGVSVVFYRLKLSDITNGRSTMQSVNRTAPSLSFDYMSRGPEYWKKFEEELDARQNAGIL